jgi:ADP-heptose:LPS heptosyltransferase
LASTSCEHLARDLLRQCVAGGQWSRELLGKLIQEPCSDALFRIVAEGLADRFDPALCDIYAELFSEAIAAVEPDLAAGELTRRYHRIRQPRVFDGPPLKRIFVLSRVTLGADVAITSVILDGLKRRFPETSVALVGLRKNWQLFAADPAIGHVESTYTRSGPIASRLSSRSDLTRILAQPGAVVIDPDSRLTQLGLLPVCPEPNYFFFESRAFGGSSDDPLPELTRRWMAQTFEIDSATPYAAPGPPPRSHDRRPVATVSLGTGDNPAKRIPGAFEQQLMSMLARRVATIWIDKGAGQEEAARAEQAISGLPPDQVRVWEGPFAGFAAMIAASDLYVGYDSAGQHVAAAAGVPLISIFAGFASPRMFHRWRPSGRGRVEVIRVDQPDPAGILAEVESALERLSFHPV